MPQNAEEKELERALDIFEIKINRGSSDEYPIRLLGVEDYNVKDVGKAVNRVQQVNDTTVYFQEQDYRNGFIDITFNAFCWKEEFELLNAVYKKGISSDADNERIIGITDIYGHGYNYAIITNLVWERAAYNAREAVHLVIEIAVLPDPEDNVFRPLKSGETVGSVAVSYLIESCSIKPRIVQPQTIFGTSDKLQILVTSGYASEMWDVTMAGIELIDPLGLVTSLMRGALTKNIVSGPFDFSLVGFYTSQLKGILSDIEISFIQGSPSFQSFNITCIVVKSENIITDGTVIESWSITDISSRASYFKTLNNYLYQIFTPVELYEVNMNVITNNPRLYPNGTLLSGALALPGFTELDKTQIFLEKCLVVDRAINRIEGTAELKKLSLKLVATRKI